jgi:hypothetical protein
VNESDGLLAAYNADMLYITCGRGSHGIAALRAAKFSCKSIYPELAGSRRMISKSKLLDLSTQFEGALRRWMLVSGVPRRVGVAMPWFVFFVVHIGKQLK